MKTVAMSQARRTLARESHSLNRYSSTHNGRVNHRAILMRRPNVPRERACI
jgi:hypothetical protein